ncbi:lytic transglycosylase domain-containing protein [Aureitalea marina]|uniref:Lytic transglycosylase n=1 Tax=Aureitalea marina TaxID=930804 RepID=A0A2S7KS78_9FLAO|nr:lytic transglycosylase domain-containing protein [Aureitalea marina]PQB05470.1 lytic transglycosylase [Aureitalea marina]
MRRYANLALFLLLSGVLFSQDTLVVDSLRPQEFTIIDSVLVQTLDGDVPVEQWTVNRRDTLMFQLQDDPLAQQIDSVWLNELYTNELFEEIYGSITQMEFNEEEPLEPYEELPTELLKQRLEELNARTPFNIEYNPSLEQVIRRYLKNRRKTMARLMALSDYYFPMFEETLDRYDLPLEMKYLAVVESALNPRARSRVGAKGLWQFMFSTGKLFDLSVSSYVDERNDPIRATEAASQYLKSLYENLGDWDLALAAYNSGPGNVSKAIRRSGGHTNYWNIRSHLPRETAGYVPAFQATMYIFEYAEEHGFKSNGPSIPYIATDTVRVKKMITLEQVAVVTNMDVAELELLNPSYKLGIIPVIDGKDYTLRLPVYAIGRFVQNEEAIYAYAEAEFNKREKPLPRYYDQNDRIRYRVRSGDYLGRIASRYGVSVRQIKNWNGLKSNNIRVGQRLTIYPRKFDEQVPATKATATAKADSGSGSDTYTVKSGDSLWSISQKFPGVSVDNIKKWNDISGTKLKPGMKLKIHKG